MKGCIRTTGQGLLDGEYAYVTALGFVGKVSLKSGAYVWRHKGQRLAVKLMTNIPRILLLSILVFVHNFGNGIYYTLGLELSPTFEFLNTSLFLCGVVWWLKADPHRSSLKNVYCPGLIVGYGWIVIMPYHLFKTRGVRGFIPLLALVGSLVVAYIYVFIFYMIFLF